MAELNTFVVRDSVTIRDAILRVIRSGLIARGVENPNVTPGSDWYVQAQAFANQLTVIEANAVLKADELMPDTSTEDGLARICAVFGLSKQAAAGSLGHVVLSASTATTVTTGSQLIDGAGLAYEVVTGGIYDDEDLIPIRAVDTGTATNLTEGEALQWVTTPTFSDSKALVASGGLTNGIDAEDDEALRERLFARIQNPPRSGNATHIAEDAEASSPSVQKAFVYPAHLGPSSVGVVVVAAPTETNKSRDIDTTLLNGTIVPYVKGIYPEHAEINVTTAANVDADVAFGLTLPEAATASPPGPGGGWFDGTPWPAPDASTTWRCTVTGVTSNTVFTVDATTLPTLNVSKVCWLSPTEWKLYSAVVIGVSGTSGAYTITLDSPFTNIASGSYIWPNCQNAQTYVDAVLAAFALMGPGEKSSNPSALVRGFRHPRSAAGWPMTLGGHLTRAITNTGPEVESAQFLHRTDGTSTVTGSAGLVTPQVPAALTDPTNIFRPRHVAFYRVP